jgi:hypothetical protein
MPLSGGTLRWYQVLIVPPMIVVMIAMDLGGLLIGKLRAIRKAAREKV